MMPHQISDLFHDLGDFQHFIRMQSVHGRPDAVKGIRFFCRCVGIDIQQLMQRNFQAACDLLERLNGGAFFTTFHLADIGWVDFGCESKLLLAKVLLCAEFADSLACYARYGFSIFFHRAASFLSLCRSVPHSSRICFILDAADSTKRKMGQSLKVVLFLLYRLFVLHSNMFRV